MRRRAVFAILFLCLLPATGASREDPVHGGGVFPPDNEGWERYRAPVVLDRDSAEGVTPGTVSPEAAVLHFYAAMIREDSRYLDVLPESADPGLIISIREMLAWKVHTVRLDKRKPLAPGKYWIMIRMKVEYLGKTEEGSDEVTVERIAGKWVVTDLPT